MSLRRFNDKGSALNAARNLTANGFCLDKSLDCLSSGLRINRASDDAAEMAISEKMRSLVRGVGMTSQENRIHRHHVDLSCRTYQFRRNPSRFGAERVRATFNYCTAEQTSPRCERGWGLLLPV